MTLPKQSGGGMFFMPELLLRQVLLQGLVDLAGDDERMSVLFGRVDDLLQGTQDGWVDELKSYFRDAVTRTEGRMAVMVGYPMDHTFTPCFSIVEMSGGENDGEALVGDRWDTATEQEGVVNERDMTGTITEYPRLVRTEVIATPWKTTIQVGAWATSPEGSTVLAAVARSILIRDKSRLMRAGVTNISLSTPGGFTPDNERYPMIGYVPIVQVAMDWQCVDQVRSGPRPGRIASISTTPGNR
jgi:hypothetical protein